MSSREMSQLTTELERLEQSITLILQEIDHNFSKCHQIITTNILPRIEKYNDSSKEIWASSKFWKQFFEESAHVSFSSYEEPATTIECESSLKKGDSGRSSPLYNRDNNDDETFLGSLSLVDESTPGNETKKPKTTKWADIVSPFEQLQREMSEYQGSSTPLTIAVDDGEEEESVNEMETPIRSRKQDILLHRVLDSNWRLRATPFQNTNIESKSDTPCSSPIEPRLHSVLFTPKRTVQEESDSEDFDGMMSPPVTMQFSVPQSRLLQTPAREVASRLVDDILRTAGGYSSEFSRENETEMDSRGNSTRTGTSDYMHFSVDGSGSPIRRK